MQPKHRRALSAPWEISSLRKGLFLLCTCVCRSGLCTQMQVLAEARGTGSPGAGGTGRYEPLGMRTGTGAGN